MEAVAGLKDDPAIGRIALSGSVSVVRQLVDAGLLDELHLFVHPATAGGSGLRLFEDGGPSRFFRLLDATPFATGVVHLVYGRTPSRRRAPTRTPRSACRRSDGATASASARGGGGRC